MWAFSGTNRTHKYPAVESSRRQQRSQGGDDPVRTRDQIPGIVFIDDVTRDLKSGARKSGVSGEGHYDVVSYAGDVVPSDVWADLDRESGAQLIDVRTRPEWAFVGVPDLSSVRKKVILLSWQDYPTMQLNPNFIAELERAVPDKSAPVYFLCRSGARSRAAAIAATEAGYQRCYNVSDGFEGALDGTRHRGRTAGWKAAGLPWLQD